MTRSRALFLIVGALSLIVYINSLAPTITWRNAGADSGDLATAVAVGGVPHPPGYPTYLVLGEVFKLMPSGDVAYRLNLLSAMCGALAVALLAVQIAHTLSTAARYRAGAEAGMGEVGGLIWPCAVAASLTLAFSGVFWSQAVIAEVYALNALFAAVLLYGVTQIRSTNRGWLVPGLFGLLGLGLGNHPTLLLLLPVLAWNLKARPRWWQVGATFAALGVGLSVYLIIPIRAATSPPVNWGMATTWPDFLWLVSAEPYRQLIFGLSWKFVPARVLGELRLLAEAFMGWGLPLGLLGLQRLMRLDRSLAWGSLVSFLLISIYAIGYDTTDSYVYLLPALLIFSLWLGWGLYELGDAVRKLARARWARGGSIAWGLLALLPLLSLAWNLPRQDLSRDNEAYSYAQSSLRLVAPGAVIIAETDPQTFALWYARYALGSRPDVAVVSSNLLPYAWYRRTLHQTHPHLRLTDQAGQPLTTLSAVIEWNASDLPVYLATLQAPVLESYRLEPADHLRRVVKNETTTPCKGNQAPVFRPSEESAGG